MLPFSFFRGRGTQCFSCIPARWDGVERWKLCFLRHAAPPPSLRRPVRTPPPLFRPPPSAPRAKVFAPRAALAARLLSAACRERSGKRGREHKFSRIVRPAVISPTLLRPQPPPAHILPCSKVFLPRVRLLSAACRERNGKRAENPSFQGSSALPSSLRPCYGSPPAAAPPPPSALRLPHSVPPPSAIRRAPKFLFRTARMQPACPPAARNVKNIRLRSGFCPVPFSSPPACRLPAAKVLPARQSFAPRHPPAAPAPPFAVRRAPPATFCRVPKFSRRAPPVRTPPRAKVLSCIRQRNRVRLFRETVDSSGEFSSICGHISY